jgi:plastocyanin
MRSSLVLTALALALVGLAAWSITPDGAAAEDQTIDSGNLYFCSPQFQDGICETSVNTGDTVTWTVSAGFHTVTECDENFAVCPPSGGFDSGQLAEGDTFAHTFNEAGAFEYYCAFHPTQMRGIINVAQAATATPAASTPPATTAVPQGGTTQSATVIPAGGLPATGGDPGGSDSWLWLGLTLTGLALVGASAGFTLAARRR